MAFVTGGFEGLMARERWRVRLPWPVPASRICREGWLLGVLVGSFSGVGGSAWMSRREVIVEA